MLVEVLRVHIPPDPKPVMGPENTELIFDAPHPDSREGLDLGRHRQYRYANGYGASVLDGQVVTEGAPFELCLVKYDEVGVGAIIDCGVISMSRTYYGRNGFLTIRCDEAELNDLLTEIKALPTGWGS